MASDISRFIREQKERTSGQIFWLTHIGKRHVPRQFRKNGLLHSACFTSGDKAWRDRVATDVVTPIARRHVLSQAMNAHLGRAVGRHSPYRDNAGDRRNI